MRERGKYYRNLKSAQVTKMYADDNNDEPAFGYRINNVHWKDKEAQRGFSVNCAVCMCEPKCSVLLHEHGDQYTHVGEIDLVELSNRMAQADPPVRIVAMYDPDTHVCHFNLVTPDGGVPSFMVLKDVLEELAYPNPKPKRLPAGEREILEAKAAVEAYAAVIKIHRSVVSAEERVKTLPPPAAVLEGAEAQASGSSVSTRP
jgi:hypothetical protein